MHRINAQKPTMDYFKFMWPVDSCGHISVRCHCWPHGNCFAASLNFFFQTHRFDGVIQNGLRSEVICYYRSDCLWFRIWYMISVLQTGKRSTNICSFATIVTSTARKLSIKQVRFPLCTNRVCPISGSLAFFWLSLDVLLSTGSLLLIGSSAS